MELNGKPQMDVMIVIVKTEMFFAQQIVSAHVSTMVRNTPLERISLLQMDVIPVIVILNMDYIVPKIHALPTQFVILLVVLTKNAALVVMELLTVPLDYRALH
jgi:hypothetical protein